MEKIIKMRPWQESASLILAGRQYMQKYNPASYNYKLLMLKRHQKSSFMPGMYVFPGGTIDAADSTLKWREIFAAFGVNNNSFASLIPKIAEQPEIYRSRQDELPREISLRITAIRETFEESGILICKHKDADTSNWAKHVSIPKNELQMWQSKVHNNATEFLTLCEKLECYPDLWALHEWRNWLTPTVLSVKRFNTIFYLACLPTIPYAEYEAVEMEDLKWEMPEDLFSKDIILPPTQQYEIARLSKFKNIEKLLDFAMECKTKEILRHLYLPIHINLKDGIVYVLPGDTMYPKEVNLLDQNQIDKSDITRYEYREMTPIKNRMEYWTTHVKIIFTDIHGKDNYMEISMPGYRKDAHGDVKNKL